MSIFRRSDDLWVGLAIQQLDNPELRPSDERIERVNEQGKVVLEDHVSFAHRSPDEPLARGVCERASLAAMIDHADEPTGLVAMLVARKEDKRRCRRLRTQVLSLHQQGADVAMRLL